jgi:hypothetical protein
MLELGAGDCRLSRLLVDRLTVFATDLSFSALRRSGLSSIAQADIASVPFRDRSFDLVLCSEVLEHLPEDVFRSALAEISRLAIQYVLISVPYRENLLENSARCGACGKISHIYGHLRSFTRRDVTGLLWPNLKPVRLWTMGLEHRCFPPLVRLRGVPVGNDRMCPHCGKISPKVRLGLWQKAVDWLQWKIPYEKSYWIAALYRRSC